MKKFKINDAEALQNNVNAIDNPILKKAAMQVIEGEMAGWTQWGSWISFAKARGEELERQYA
jgi:hypothetical protein